LIFYVNLYFREIGFLCQFVFSFVVHFVLVYCAATDDGSRDLPIYL